MSWSYKKQTWKTLFFIDSGVNMHDTNVNARIKYYSENQPERRLLKRLTLQKLLPKLCSPKCWNLFLDDSCFQVSLTAPNPAHKSTPQIHIINTCACVNVWGISMQICAEMFLHSCIRTYIIDAKFCTNQGHWITDQ